MTSPTAPRCSSRNQLAAVVRASVYVNLARKCRECTRPVASTLRSTRSGRRRRRSYASSPRTPSRHLAAVPGLLNLIQHGTTTPRTLRLDRRTQHGADEGAMPERPVRQDESVVRLHRCHGKHSLVWDCLAACVALRYPPPHSQVLRVLRGATSVPPRCRYTGGRGKRRSRASRPRTPGSLRTPRRSAGRRP